MFAKKLFKQQGINNIELVNGIFDEAFPMLISTIDAVNFLYVDGNHRKQATIDYFEMALTKADDDSVFVFDDIHWNEEMEEAWDHIRHHSKVRISIDLFFIGIVFFRSEQKQQEHFDIRY